MSLSTSLPDAVDLLQSAEKDSTSCPSTCGRNHRRTSQLGLKSTAAPWNFAVLALLLYRLKLAFLNLEQFLELFVDSRFWDSRLFVCHLEGR